MKLKITAFLLAIGVTLGLSGCTQQTTIAALVTVLGNASASIAVIEGNNDLATKLKTDTAAASADVLAWKSGTPAQDVIQAINIVEDDLNLIPGTGPYAALVDLALGTAQSIIEILNPGGAPVANAVTPHRRVIQLSNPPKNKAQFKSQWNAIVDRNPAMSSARIQ